MFMICKHVHFRLQIWNFIGTRTSIIYLYNRFTQGDACFDFPANWKFLMLEMEMVRNGETHKEMVRDKICLFVCSIYEIVDDSANRWSLDKKVKIVQFLLQWLRTSFRTSSYGNCVFPCAATCTDRRDTSVLFPINDLLLNQFWNDWTLDKF